jgi:hypothetical protein
VGEGVSERRTKGERSPSTKVGRELTLNDDGARKVNADLPPSLSEIELLEQNTPEVERLRRERSQRSVSATTTILPALSPSKARGGQRE